MTGDEATRDVTNCCYPVPNGPPLEKPASAGDIRNNRPVAGHKELVSHGQLV